VQQAIIDGAAALTNSIEQRAAEIRNSAEEGPGEQQPTDQGPTYGYSKDGKQIVSKEPVAPAPAPLRKRWDVWVVGTGLFGHYNSFNDNHYSSGQFALGLDGTAYAGTGYAWRFGSFEVGPWASLEYDYADGFRPLRELASRVGGRAAWHAEKWLPYVQLAWQHEYLDTWTGIDRNAVWGSVGVAYRINNSFTVFTDYSGEFGSDYWVQQVDLGLGYSW
jgi:hypothetical protein